MFDSAEDADHCCVFELHKRYPGVWMRSPSNQFVHVEGTFNDKILAFHLDRDVIGECIKQISKAYGESDMSTLRVMSDMLVRYLPKSKK